jgi:ethanolamine ammonia-lyase small subunit
MSDLAKPATDLWQSLQHLTQARIAIGRTGDAQTTDAVLAFEVAQAQARDAVHLSFDTSALKAALAELNLHPIELRSAAVDRATYLRRPDEGARLSATSRAKLLASTREVSSREVCKEISPRLTIVIADGLSAAAPMKHALPLITELLQGTGVEVAPLVLLAREARVALGDEIGEIVQAPAVLILIGERPGLTTPESLGAYLTWAPRVGRTNAERNCISNIHPNGLSYAAAARKLAMLLANARRLGATGVDLHDEHDDTPQLGAESDASRA